MSKNKSKKEAGADFSQLWRHFQPPITEKDQICVKNQAADKVFTIFKPSRRRKIDRRTPLIENNISQR